MNNKIDIFEHYSKDEILDWIETSTRMIEYECLKCELAYQCWTKSDFNRSWGKEIGIWDRFTVRLHLAVKRLERLTKALNSK